jgi:plasmid stabilization system protein ParE
VTRQFTIAPAAEQDIFDIGRYVEADSPSAAQPS